MLKILQIGEGNFLRAFADFYVQTANEKSVMDAEVYICQPRQNTKVINALKAQNCQWDVLLRGRKNGAVIDHRKHINCVSACIDTVGEYDKLEKLFCDKDLRIIISNTTEAGICFNNNDKFENSPAVSFPGKVTALLYKRYLAGFGGVLFLPVELIEDNGDALKKCVLDYARLWRLESGFAQYVNNDCVFCCTLVDRIVTGHIDSDSDACSVACEPYESWVIQDNPMCRALFPVDKLGLNVTFTNDLKTYRTRKVRILNGAHTMSVLCAFLCGFDIVRDMMNNEIFSKYINIGLDEIKQTIDLPQDELDSFAGNVLERFNNPFIDHKLLDISLNSISKFKARCLDTVLDYVKTNNRCPAILTFSMAALIAFYTHKGSDRQYEICDSAENIEFFRSIENENPANIIHTVLSNKNMWGCDLTEIEDFESIVLSHYENICNNGMENTVKVFINE